MADSPGGGFDDLSRLVQAELWSTDVPPTEPGRVSMPLADYVVHPLPGLPPPADEDGEDATTISPEHVVCKQALKPQRAALVD